MIPPPENPAILNRLRRQWAFLWPVAALIAAGVWGLGISCGFEAALPSGLQSAAVLAYVLVRMRPALEKNHRLCDPRLRPNIGAANGLTLSRSVLIAALAGALFQPWPWDSQADWRAWLPGALYLSAAVLDFADGYLARSSATETRLGEFLDTEIDALGLMAASLFLVQSGRVPTAYVFVGAGYYALKAAMWIRGKLKRPLHAVRPRAMARLVAGLEMAFAGVALLPVFEPQALHLAAWVMMAALGESLMRDWFVVCGWAAADGQPIRASMRRLERIAAYVFPLVLRTAIFTAAVRLWVPASHSLGASLMSPLHSAMVLIGAGCCFFGVAARTAAMLLSFIGAGLISAEGAVAEAAVLLACTLTLMITGAGPWRLWQPEDRFLLEKQGSARKAKTKGSDGDTRNA